MLDTYNVNILKSNIYLYHYFAQEGVVIGLLYKARQFLSNISSLNFSFLHLMRVQLKKNIR